jgi:hypothetical protein
MSAISTRNIGGTQVSALGYGAMGIAAFYGSIQSDEERFKVCTPFTDYSPEILTCF